MALCVSATLFVFLLISCALNAVSAFVIVSSQVKTSISGSQLTTKNGSEVSTIQSGREVPLGLLPYLPLHAPKEALEAVPELIILRDPVKPLTTSAYKVISMSFTPPHTLEIAAASGERIVLLGASRGYVCTFNASDPSLSAEEAPFPPSCAHPGYHV